MDWSEVPTPFMVLQLVDEGKVDEAIEKATQIPWPYWRNHTLREIAKKVGKTNPSAAKRALDLAKSLLNELEGDYWRGIASAEISSIKVELGLIDEALQHLDEAVEFMNKVDDVGAKPGTLREVASIVSKHVNKDQRIKDKVKQVLRRAVLHAETHEDPSITVGHLIEIAHEFGKSGFTDDAYNLFIRALGMAKKLEDSGAKFGYMREITKRLSKVGLGTEIPFIVDEIVSEVQKIDDEWERSKNLSELVESLTEAVKEDQTNKDVLLSKVEEVSSKVTERWWKSKTLSDVVKTYIEIGNVDRAQQLIPQIEFNDLKKEVQDTLDKVLRLDTVTRPQIPPTGDTLVR